MSDLVYAQREIDNLINLLADARTENMKLNEYIKRQAMDILLCKSGNGTLHEENTRLRAALERIADTDPDEGTQWFHEVARAALAQPATGEKHE